MLTPVVKIIRSPRRKRTVQAKQVNGTILVYLPTGMTAQEENRWIQQMVQLMQKKNQRRTVRSDEALKKRAQELNKAYFHGILRFSIWFVANQKSRFGSCSSRTRAIRISERVATMPRWVQDYIIIHELAHLIHPNHSRRFWDVVNQYKYAERARGYLIAVGLEQHNE